MKKQSFLCLFFCLILLVCFAGCNMQSSRPAESGFSLCKDGHNLEEVALVPATCHESGIAAHSVCLRCGELFDETGSRISLDALTLPASHDPDGVWSFDEKGHFQVCKICGEAVLAESHSFKNGVCTACGATKEEPLCSHSGGIATCLEKAICEKCGKPYGRLASHAKVYLAEEHFLASEATCTKRASYHTSCSLCGFVYAETFTSGEPLGHEGKATCQTKAVCVRCGQTFGSLGEHDFSLEIVSDAALASAATCSLSATYYKTCSVCGAIGGVPFAVGDTNSALHQFAVDENLSTDAVHTLVCELCKTAKTEAHTGSSASCTTPVVCSICGSFFVPPNAHLFSIKEPTQEYLASSATCQQPATYYLSCKYCEQAGDKTFSYGQTADHSYQNGACIWCGAEE